MSNDDSVIEYPFEEIPDIGTAMEVARGIYWVRMPLAPPLRAINVYLMRDGNGWAILDTGVGDDQTRDIWTRLLSEVLHDSPVTRVILTHHHADHAGLSGWLCRRLNAPLFASALEFGQLHAVEWAQRGDIEARIAALRQAGMPESLIEWRRTLSLRSHVESPPTEFHRMADKDPLIVDGESWQVLVGYGHTPEHVCLYCPGRRILIAGDQLLPRVNASLDTWDGLPADDLLWQWLKSFSVFEQLPEDTLVLPSHDEPFIGIRARVRQIRERYDTAMGFIEEQCRRSPRTAFEVAEAMTSATAPPYSRFLACGNAYAHLKLMESRLRVALVQDANGIHRWSSVS